METKYKAIGIVDGTSDTEHDNPFSLAARQKELQRSASAQRINRLRSLYGNLIGTTPSKEESTMDSGDLPELDNPFKPHNVHK